MAISRSALMFFLIILIKYQHIHQIGLPFSGNGNCGGDKSDFIVEVFVVIGNVGKSVEGPLTSVASTQPRPTASRTVSRPALKSKAMILSWNTFGK